MWERLKQWQSTAKLSKCWMTGAIATPVVLGMMWWFWLLPARRIAHGARANLVDRHRETLISDIGMIATVAGGLFLLLKFHFTNSAAETSNLSGVDLSGADLSGVDLSGVDLSSADLNGAMLKGADLSGANLSGANLISADLNGANLNGAECRYANLSDADLRYVNLSGANLTDANLSGANLSCALLTDANLSDANLSNTLIFFINLREVLNLEPFQLEASPSPFLCNVALPSYSKQPEVNPDRSCDLIPQLLSARYDISLEEAQEIVYEARQHHWD